MGLGSLRDATACMLALPRPLRYPVQACPVVQSRMCSPCSSGLTPASRDLSFSFLPHLSRSDLQAAAVDIDSGRHADTGRSAKTADTRRKGPECEEYELALRKRTLEGESPDPPCHIWWAFPPISALGKDLPPTSKPLFDVQANNFPGVDWRRSYLELASWFAPHAHPVTQSLDVQSLDVPQGGLESPTRATKAGDIDETPATEIETPGKGTKLSLPRYQTDEVGSLPSDASTANALCDGGERTAFVIFITGFVGKTLDGRPATLQRNGSDTSAVAFGSLLRAEGVTVWSDVAGIYTADPRFVCAYMCICVCSFMCVCIHVRVCVTSACVSVDPSLCFHMQFLCVCGVHA